MHSHILMKQANKESYILSNSITIEKVSKYWIFFI